MPLCEAVSFRTASAPRNRDEVAARELWSSLPPVYRQCAVVYTDFWAAYGMAILSKRHRAVGKAKQRGLGGFTVKP